MSPRLLVTIVAALLVSALLLAGLLVIGFLPLLGDPPPDPATAPVEVVANDRGEAVCALNRGRVAPGRHQVTVITAGLSTRVEMRDEGGRVVFRHEGDSAQQLPAGEEMREAVPPPDGAPDSVELRAGKYTVVCVYDGGRSGEAELVVATE